MSFAVPNKYRIRKGRMGSDDSVGNYGAFFIPNRAGDTSARRATPLTVIASENDGWQHVSVSFADRCPTWQEMHFVKVLFWGEHAAVMQLHPAQADYVNNHSYCLHLWRPVGVEIPTPPPWMVGDKSLGVLV